MCSNQNWFQQFSTLAKDIPIILGDNSTIQGVGQGHIHVHMHTRNEWNNIILQNVLYVSELHGNLLSISHLTNCGANVYFAEQGCHIHDPHGNVIYEGQQHQNLYLMDIYTVPLTSACIAIVESFPIEGDSLSLVYKVALMAQAPFMKADLTIWH
jgi:hypothetical protein